METAQECRRADGRQMVENIRETACSLWRLWEDLALKIPHAREAQVVFTSGGGHIFIFTDTSTPRRQRFFQSLLFSTHPRTAMSRTRPSDLEAAKASDKIKFTRQLDPFSRKSSMLNGKHFRSYFGGLRLRTLPSCFQQGAMNTHFLWSLFVI